MNELQHWQLHEDASGLLWASLDVVGESSNVLATPVLDELARLLAIIERAPPKGVVFRSGKAAGFIAGADVKEFGRLASPGDAETLLARGWDLFNRLEKLPCPTLALVRGHCLGGGLEFALACRYLVAVDEPATRLGLPEVLLGIFPGWGGMLRLPKRIGPAAALDLMLRGKTVDAAKAHRLGLADACVPPRVMDNAARQLLLERPRRRALPLLQKLLNGPLKGVVAEKAKKQLAQRVREKHYPAPYAIIDLWQRRGGNALAAPAIIANIFASPTAQNLLRVFALQERLKGLGKASDFQARRVHVVGAGVMGGDIAAWCAARGLLVTLQDQDVAKIAPAIQRAKAAFARRSKDRLQVQAQLDRLIPDPEGHGVARADVVIEAIFENLAAKRQLLHQLSLAMRPDAVLASNTSSLLLEDLRVDMAAPERLVGLHFFNPVAKMPLVEVVAAANGDAAMLTRASAFVRQIDRLPLPVQSAPGFLVNAVLGPYMLAAIRAVDSGIAPETVDEAMLDFGMPMGPIELVDMVGLDVALAAGEALTEPGVAPPKCLSERISAGHLGRKSGQGFYVYKGGKAEKAPPEAPPPDLAASLINPLLEKTRQLLAAGVVADADLADAGVIFGTGFAPFTGGPLNYLKNLEKNHV